MDVISIGSLRFIWSSPPSLCFFIAIGGLVLEEITRDCEMQE